jgi:hypothetical protein
MKRKLVLTLTLVLALSASPAAQAWCWVCTSPPVASCAVAGWSDYIIYRTCYSYLLCGPGGCINNCSGGGICTIWDWYGY